MAEVSIHPDSLKGAIDPKKPVTIAQNAPQREAPPPAASSDDTPEMSPTVKAEALLTRKELAPLTPERRFQEAEIIVNSTVQQKARQLAEQKQATPQEMSTEMFAFLLRHRSDPSIDIPQPIDLQGNSIRLHFTNGEYQAAVGGTGLAVNRIISKHVDNGVIYLRCDIAGTGEEDVPLSEIIRAQMITDGDAILSVLPDGDQRNVAAAYMEAVKKGPEKPGEELKVDVDDTTMKEAGRKSGMFSTDSVVTFAELEGNEKIRDELVAMVDGSNIVEPQLMAQILMKTNDIPSRIGNAKRSIATNQAEISKLDLRIHTMEDDTSEGGSRVRMQLEAERASLKAELAAMEQELAALSKLQEAMPDLASLTAVLTNLSAEQIQDVNDSLENGDMKDVFQAILGSDKLTDEQKKMFGNVEKGLAYAGAGILAIFIIMMMQAMNSQG